MSKKNVKSFINSSQKVEDKPKSIDRPTIKVIHKYLILTVKLKKLYLPNIKTPASNILAQLHTTILSYEIATVLLSIDHRRQAGCINDLHYRPCCKKNLFIINLKYIFSHHFCSCTRELFLLFYAIQFNPG